MPETNYKANLIPVPGKVYGGNLGGGTPPRQVVVSLNNAQIRALPSTPVVIVPATETLAYVGMPTRIPVIQQAVANWKVSQGLAYTNINDDTIALFYGSDAGNGPISGRINATLFLSTSIAFGPIAVLDSLNSQNDGIDSGRVFPRTTNLRDSIQDNGIYLAAFNAGDFVGGGASDILQVSLLYRLFNTQTGEFE